MAIRVSNLIMDIEEDISSLKTKTAKKLKISPDSIQSFKIIKESIDARKRDIIKFNYSVEVTLDDEDKLISKISDKDVIMEQLKYDSEINFGDKELKHRPIIVGMGPAGMFAGLLMAKKGYKPIIIERGQCVEKRSESVKHFFETGELNLDSNVQFGEGGAGTFSDGKLTTRIKDPRCDFILEEFVKAGAPEEIVYSGKPHIGTDILKDVVKNIRNEIIDLGGEVHFSSRLDDLIIKDGKLKAVVFNNVEIPCEVLILSTGHSARDTYEMLYKKNIYMEPKPFSIGVRVEHSQNMINENQYGKYANHPRLKSADYRLSHRSKVNNRSVYSFCMCPGGEVVAAASEEGRLVTNGMSLYKRDKDNANAAIVVSVSKDDFEGDYPLSGMEFQRHYEKLAYDLGGSGYVAPVQLLGDFLDDKVSKEIGNIKPSYLPGYEFSDLRKCLPNYVVSSLKEGFVAFDRKIKGFAQKDAILTGVETRTSAPVRLVRNESFASINLEGLYPAGEGAGYAGGIVSAGVDGLKVAESIMEKYKPYEM